MLEKYIDNTIISREENFYNNHYILLDKNNNIIDGWSNGIFPDRDTTNAICINDKAGYQFRLIFHKLYTPESDEFNPNPNSYIKEVYSEENPSLFDMEGIPLYKYEDGEILPLSQVEKSIERAKLENKQLPLIKSQLIADSKNLLSQFLANNPLKWTDNKLYSVTQTKQSLLMQQLALHIIDPSVKLYWNASGESNTEWEIEDLVELAKAITTYVQPYIQYQQQKEIEINNAETADEARSITVDYSSIS